MANANSEKSPSKITVWQYTIDNPSSIFMTLLIKALDITHPEYGDYVIVPSKPMEQGRAIKRLSNKYDSILDIGHFASSVARDKGAIPIRIPLLDGLLGYRICLINKGEQQKFLGINSLDDFVNKKLTIGQHQDWPDAEILQSNGLDVRTTYKYSLLFQQLEKKRFDCFLRGINEINDELDSHPNSEFDIENSLVFHYPFPIFFFVHENEVELAQRVTLGISRLRDNGTLASVLADYYQDKVKRLKLNERTLININNPILPENIGYPMRIIPWLND